MLSDKAFQQVLNLIFGPEVMIAESGFEVGEYLDGGLTVSNVKIIAFVMALILALIVVLFMKQSRMGQAIRATSQNARAARPYGPLPFLPGAAPAAVGRRQSNGP